MLSRISRSPVGQWRSYLARQQSSERVSVGLIHVIYSVWIMAFLLKLIGSSWDVGWHFRYLRDDLAPPHIINTLGMLLAVAVLGYQTWTTVGIETWGLRWLQIGTAVFIAAIPLDLINHRLFGLDITSRSSTHAMLYGGTAIMLVGMLRSWLQVTAPGHWQTVVAFGFWAFLLEDVLFPLGQQEYGTLALAAYNNGTTTADPELISAGGANITAFALGAIPLWLYPVYLVLASTLVLLAARLVMRQRWTATTLAAIYIGYRLVDYGLLRLGDFPPSFIPVMLLAGGVVIDIAVTRRLHPIMTSAALVVAFYGSAWVIGQFTLMPSFGLTTAPAVLVLLTGMLWLAQRWQPQPRPLAAAAQS